VYESILFIKYIHNITNHHLSSPRQHPFDYDVV
jgi:hypothetical protein